MVASTAHHVHKIYKNSVLLGAISYPVTGERDGNSNNNTDVAVNILRMLKLCQKLCGHYQGV